MELTVVLVRPIYAGNVGSVLRVAANFSARELVLVSPRATTDDPDFRRMAMGAGRHVPVREVATLAEAVADLDTVVVTTSLRTRDPRGAATPPAVREKLAKAGARRVAVVFGPEQSGLTRDELAASHLLLSVPTSAAFPVLNLAQAVAVVLASLREETLPLPERDDALDRPAPAEELQAALEHLQQVLLDSGFLDQVNPARVMDQLRRLLGRSIPTRREAAILRGLASHIAYIWRRSPGDG